MRHVLSPHATQHPLDARRRELVLPVLALTFLVGCGGLQSFNTPPGPNPPSQPLQCDVETIAESTLPAFSATGLSASLNACAGCHIIGDPLGRGAGWGVNNDTSDSGWHWATLQLFARDSAIAGEDVTKAPFFAKFAGFDPTHPDNEAARADLADVYGTFLTSGGTACAGAPTLDENCDNPSYAKFTELGLGTSINTCATCHFSGTPTGRGIVWGNAGDPSSQAWYLASRALQRQADQVDLATQNTSLYTHFSPGNAQHPPNAALAASMGIFIDTFRSVGEGDCGGEPEPEPEPVVEPEPLPLPIPPAACLAPYDLTEAEAFFDSTLKTPLLQCSSCHRTGPNVNNGNLRFIDADAYAITMDRITIGAAVPPKDTLMGKIMRVPGSTPLPNHNYNFAQPSAAAEWLTRLSYGVEIDAPGCGEDLCLADYPETESLKFFDDNMKAAFVSCSACHRASPNASNGNVSFDATTAYQAALLTLGADSLPATESKIGKILRVPGSTALPTHNFGYTKGTEALTWIGYHRDGYEAPCP